MSNKQNVYVAKEQFCMCLTRFSQHYVVKEREIIHYYLPLGLRGCEFLRTTFKFRKRKKILSSLVYHVYVLHTT